ncbi:MAG TPA: ABC transporter permease [Anaerolineales bacterium]|nr:ABC transporter permease [Anaerolineales bacterium]
MKALKKYVREILQYPSAVVGSIMILLLVAVSVYALVTIPYEKALQLWRGGEDVWYSNPQYAPPAWMNYFTSKDLPVSFTLNSRNAGENQSVTKEVVLGEQNTSRTFITYTFDFNYDEFPQEVALLFDTTYEVKQPFVSVLLATPDGREVRIGDFGVSKSMTYRLSQDTKLQRRLGGLPPMQGLFADPNSEELAPLKGTYQLLINGISFEQDSQIDAEFVFYGLVYGLAGTDHLRRDLFVALLYGAPIALAFGLLAALGTSVLTMIIAATGAYYGGWVDELIQRITEVNLVLPFLAILIMVGTFYDRSIWTILGVTILLSIFTGAIKSYRAIFMQVKESAYIEAARAYGASSGRVIFRYLIPRMIPLLIPGLVSAVPAFVFLEASLAVLGLGDPSLPTWGKIINDAWLNGALYKGYYYWILEPAILLMITGLGFAMVGYSLDRVFNPRLRGL